MISQEDINKLVEIAKKIRLEGLEMARHAGKGGAHFGGSYSAVEILVALYGHSARYKASDPLWEDRDRILISKRHCVLALYPVLSEFGFFEKDKLNSFVDDDGLLASYPVNPSIGLEYSAGTLGMAPAVAIGRALAAKRDGRDFRVFVLVGDGECNEGSIWEAFMSAAQFKLNNLTLILDNNRLCYDGLTADVMGLGDLPHIMEGFGWQVDHVNGHDIGALCGALDSPALDRPQIVIADTLKGKGISFMEQQCQWHHGVITDEQYELAREEIMEGLKI